MSLAWQAKLKSLESALNSAKRDHKQALEALKALEQRRKVLGLELKQLHGENSSMEEQVQVAALDLCNLAREVKEASVLEVTPVRRCSWRRQGAAWRR